MQLSDVHRTSTDGDGQDLSEAPEKLPAAAIVLFSWLVTPGTAGAAPTSQVTSRTGIEGSISGTKEIQMIYSLTTGTNLCLWNLMYFQVRELLLTDILPSVSVKPTDEENV